MEEANEVRKVLPFRNILLRFRHSVLRIARNAEGRCCPETIQKALLIGFGKAEPVGL